VREEREDAVRDEGVAERAPLLEREGRPGLVPIRHSVGVAGDSLPADMVADTDRKV
jgi:hypothetical protein